MQILEIRSFRNIRTLSRAFGFNLRQLKQHSASPTLLAARRIIHSVNKYIDTKKEFLK